MNRKRIKEWRSNRIYYYQYHADADYWDNYWKESITNEYYKKYELGELDEYNTIFLKYLKKNHHILEAGCGTGRYVLALQSRGFDYIEGIEWGSKTVEIIKNLYPDLPISVGDVTKIERPDNIFDNYISLGVVEHRKEGPEPFLEEAYRVLKNGGLAIFTVPYINPFRKIKGKLGFYNIDIANENIFYQYAFSKKEFCAYLQKSGFTIIETSPLAGYFGIQEELPFLYIFLDKLPGGWRIKNYLKKSSWVNFFGHICCYICKKT